MKKQKQPNSNVDILREKAEIQLKNNGINSGSELYESDSLRLIHELEVQKIELEIQNEELRQAKLELEEYIRNKNILLYREITLEIIRILAESENLHDSVQLILNLLKSRFEIDAVAIRLRDGDDFPYYAQNGFSTEFIDKENSLLDYDEKGNICIDNSENPCLSCLCGMVVSGNAKTLGSNTTKEGSWWTNNASSTEVAQMVSPILHSPRFHCVKLGYTSIALVPIRNKEKIIGMIQLNDFRKDRFNINMIKNLDGIASQLGISLIRKQTEDDLRASEERLRTITENAPNIIAELDETGKIIYFSRVLPGYKMSDVIGQNFYNWSLPEYHEEMLQAFERVINTGVPQSYKTKGYGINGAIRWYQANLSRVNNGSKIKNAILIASDITEHVEAEERRRAILQTTMDGFWLLDINGHLLDVNETYCHMSGYSRAELLTMSISSLEDYENKEDTIAHIQKVIQFGEDRFESRHRRKDGSTFDVEISTQFQNAEGGRFITFLHDISVRKKAEEMLRQSEQRYKSLFQGNHTAILLIDPSTGEIKDANTAACKFYGWMQSEICAKNISEINTLTPEEIKVELKNSVEENRNHFFFKHRLADGKIKEVEVYSGPLTFGNTSLLYSIVHDITERNLTEKALRESEFMFRKYMEFAPHGIFVANEKGEYIDVNHSACRITGYEKDELLRMSIIELVPREFLSIAGNHFNRVVTDGFATEEIPYLRKDGTLGYWIVDAVKLSDKVFLGFVVDTTERKISEEALKEKERLLRESQSVANIGSYSANLINQTWVSSEEIYQIFGIDKDYPHTIQGWMDRVHPEMRVELYNELVNNKPGNKRFDHVYKIIKKNDGTERWIQGLGKFEFDELLNPIRLFGTIQDITVRKKSEEAIHALNERLEERVKERTTELLDSNSQLLKAEEKYRTVADFANNWEYWMNSSGEFNYISPSCERISGYKAEDFIQNPGLLIDMVHPEDLPIYDRIWKKENHEKDCHHEIQYRIIKSDGSVRWVKHVSRRIFDSSGTSLGIRGSLSDITGRKAMEDLLKTSNQKYRLLSENINDGIFTYQNGHFDYINHAMTIIFGYDEHEFNRMKISDLLDPLYLDNPDFLGQPKMLLKRRKSFDSRCIRKDGTTIFAEFITNYIDKDKVIYGVVHDISEKKQIQENIVKAIIQTEEKERAHFSKELHDGLGPLLSTIKLYLQWSERAKINSSREEIIHKAEDILEEALTTVKEISNKLSPHLLINYGINSAIQNFVNKLLDSSGIQIVYESNLTRRLGNEIEAAIYRAVIECINNTLKYAQASKIKIVLVDSVDHLSLRYKDDGIGFKVEETIAMKKGLGLFNLSNRIHSIGGKILLQSVPGKGVDYKITIDL